MILDKFYEADNVPARGASGTAGSLSRDYTIPSGAIWTIREFGGSASIEQTEVELMFSQDGGSTWVNPWDANETKIRCLHLQNGNVASVLNVSWEFAGATSTILRIKAKNYNAATAAEVVGWFAGCID